MPVKVLTPPACVTLNALFDNPTFNKLAKPTRDKLFIATSELVRSLVSTQDHFSNGQQLPCVSVPHYRLSHWMDERDVQAALEWLEIEEFTERTQIDDRPVVRFSDDTVTAGFGVFKPESKRLTEKMVERIQTPQSIYFSGATTPLETMQFDCLTQLELRINLEEAEAEIANLTRLHWLKALDSLVSFQSRYFWFASDRQSNRMSTPLVNMPVHWRTHLRLEGERVAIVHVPHIDALLLGMCARAYRPTQSDPNQFLELACSNQLFEAIGNGIGVSADTADSLFCTYIHSEMTSDTPVNPVEQIVRDRWPTVAACVTVSNWQKRNGLSVEMHKLSRSISDEAASAVFCELVREPFCAVVSDGLIVKTESAKTAQRVLSDAFREHGASPTVLID